jgi:hypothetical protein
MYWPIGAPRVYAAGDPLQIPHDEPTNNDGSTLIALTSEGEVPNGAPSAARDGAHCIETPGDSNEPQQQSSKTSDSKRKKRRSKSKPSISAANGVNAAQEPESGPGGEILAMRAGRNGTMFATITRSTLTIWQSKPVAAVTSIIRSAHSLQSYGANLDVLLRPDSTLVVVQTSGGYLMTYTISADPTTRIYHPELSEDIPGVARRKSMFGRSQVYADPFSGPGEGYGVAEVSLRFNMVIKVDAGIAKALALEHQLLIATKRPPSIQIVRWVSDESGSRATTELLKSMPWISKGATVVDMIHDRPMNISGWITDNGHAYAVQLQSSKKRQGGEEPKSLFKGFCFHAPDSESEHAVKTAICARFSLMAVGTLDCNVFIYTARDYDGHIPLSHKLIPPSSRAIVGRITSMSYSPDGYALFVGFEHGWAMWSVYGKLLGTSFGADRSLAETGGEIWLTAVKELFWSGGGSQIVLLGPRDNRLWVLDVARSAVAGCFSAANVARSLLLTHTGFMIYRGYDLPDLGTSSLDNGLWHHVQIPANYLHHQWPIRSAAISSDGRYVAVAGRRGLAHYSVTSGRWKTFDDPSMEDEFTVRGGMCWHQHVLIAAVESTDAFQVGALSNQLHLKC